MAVRAVLNKYAAAYSHLDAAAAQAVWPAVNRPALSRAFEGLASQRVSLERCDIDVNAATARATCAGSATWSPESATAADGRKRGCGAFNSPSQAPTGRS